MKRVKTALTGLFLLVFLAGCSNKASSENEIEEPSVFKEIDSYKDKHLMITALYLADTSDWLRVKDLLLHERNQRLAQFTDINTLSLVCFTAPMDSLKFNEDPNIVWETEYQPYLACSLDNSAGFWRFGYGGRNTLLNGWKKRMPLE